MIEESLLMAFSLSFVLPYSIRTEGARVMGYPNSHPVGLEDPYLFGAVLVSIIIDL